MRLMTGLETLVKESMMQEITDTKISGLTMGRLIFQKTSHLVAPSM